MAQFALIHGFRITGPTSYASLIATTELRVNTNCILSIREIEPKYRNWLSTSCNENESDLLNTNINIDFDKYAYSCRLHPHTFRTNTPFYQKEFGDIIHWLITHNEIQNITGEQI